MKNFLPLVRRFLCVTFCLVSIPTIFYAQCGTHNLSNKHAHTLPQEVQPLIRQQLQALRANIDDILALTIPKRILTNEQKKKFNNLYRELSYYVYQPDQSLHFTLSPEYDESTKNSIIMANFWIELAQQSFQQGDLILGTLQTASDEKEHEVERQLIRFKILQNIIDTFLGEQL
jgi:hypothetical protein